MLQVESKQRLIVAMQASIVNGIYRESFVGEPSNGNPISDFWGDAQDEPRARIHI